MPKRSWFQRYLRFPLEAALAFLALGAIRLLPADWASALGGWLGRTIGPRLGLTRRARSNLRLAFPGIAEAEVERIVRGMWDNLGRMLLEYPHLARLARPEAGRVEVINEQPIVDAVMSGRPGVFFGAHLGNFEVVPLYAARRGLLLNAFARAPNNPLIDKVITAIRGSQGARILNKGRKGALGAIDIMRQNGYLAVLIDQKQNRGEAMTFFGHPAMTAVAPAVLALRFKATVVLCRTERLKGARYRITIGDPLALPDTGNAEEDARILTQTITSEVERWIRDKPEDWLWLHRRWPREVMRQA